MKDDMLPRRLKLSLSSWKIELKNKLIKGMVRPAPIDMATLGVIAFNIRCQSYDSTIEENEL